MSRVERSALVRHSASRMFHLVNEVDAYPSRFAWCERAEVSERGEAYMLAQLDVRFAGMRVRFATRNVWETDRRIDLSLVEGPFSALSGSWQFQTLAEDACKVSLLLDFDVAGRWLGTALATGFRGLADRMVDDFVRAASKGDGRG